MGLLVAEAIVLHAFDYLESSRIVKLVTRDAGLRSALAKGARKSRRRFGSGLDLFGQGTAQLHTKPGRELDMLSAFEDVRARPELGADLEKFAGAETIAEIVLRFGNVGADAELFAATAAALDTLAASPAARAREATLAGAWQIVAALGFAPTLTECAQCGSPITPDATSLFTHSAGGVLCGRCAALSAGGWKLPGPARAAILEWIESPGAESREPGAVLSDKDARAHQRLLREFLDYHLHDGRTLRAYDLWESAGWSAPAAEPAVAR